jgi:hypothetical protein
MLLLVFLNRSLDSVDPNGWGIYAISLSLLSLSVSLVSFFLFPSSPTAVIPLQVYAQVKALRTAPACLHVFVTWLVLLAPLFLFFSIVILEWYLFCFCLTRKMTGAFWYISQIFKNWMSKTLSNVIIIWKTEIRKKKRKLYFLFCSNTISFYLNN